MSENTQDRRGQPKQYITEVDWLRRADPRDYKGKEFGRAHFVTEIEASEIKAKNKKLQTEHKKRSLMVHRKIEDIEMSRELGISIKELNQHRMNG